MGAIDLPLATGQLSEEAAMRLAGDKIILAISCLIFLISCLMISFVAYFLCFVATVVQAGVAGFAGIGESVAIVILYFLGAILLACIAIAFMLTSPLDFVRFLLQFLA
jgi:hypothetical protein